MSVLKDRFAKVEWVSPDTFILEGVKYHLPPGQKDRKTRADQAALLKTRDFFDAYALGIGARPTRNVLELGVNQGGSAFFFTSWLEAEKLVGIDLAPAKAKTNVDEALKAHPRADAIRLYWATSQDDEAQLSRILSEDFDGPLDLVVDDASHFYAETKRSFEIIFPALRANGIYAIEDWAWAHVPGFAAWRDRPALSNLLLDLSMVNAQRSDVIAEIRIFKEVLFVRKGRAELDSFRFSDFAHMQDRGRALL